MQSVTVHSTCVSNSTAVIYCSVRHESVARGCSQMNVNLIPRVATKTRSFTIAILLVPFILENFQSFKSDESSLSITFEMITIKKFTVSHKMSVSFLPSIDSRLFDDLRCRANHIKRYSVLAV